MQDSVTKYLNEIGTYPLLVKEQEVELAKTIEAGAEAEGLFLDSFGVQFDENITTDCLTEIAGYNPESIESNIPAVIGKIAFLQSGILVKEINEKVASKKDAKELFIKSNLRLVVSIAKRYRKTERLELLDLIQEGNLGLEHAVDKFDFSRGFKFSTYATWWIRQAIGRAIDDKSATIRIPGHRRADLRRANKAAEESGDIKLSAEQYRLNTLLSVDSLDATNDDTNQSLMHTLADESSNDAYKNVEHRRLIEEFLEQLPDERAREIFRHRFGLDGYCVLSAQELAKKYGIKSQRVYQILNRSMDTYRDMHDSESIDIY